MGLANLALPAERIFRQLRWTGKEDVAGKSVLLYAEQGFGDTIQFCRYVPLVAARGAHVILEVQQHLRGIMEAAFEQVTVIASAGHLTPLEQPALTARAIAEFVRGIKSKS